MDSKLKQLLTEILNNKITAVLPELGGDISEAYKISTQYHSYFIKINGKSDALKMFHEEAKGLNEIQKSGTILTPNVIHVGSINSKAFLLLEYVESKKPSNEEMYAFGEDLAKLHECSHQTFGWESSNFIGSLPQQNLIFENWVEFYFLQRLKPQLQIAFSSGRLLPGECPSEHSIIKNLNSLLGTPKPSLLHGDLWGGNFLISLSGQAYLIDPASYYGHSEVDIAMTKLFGGFNSAFYQGYFSKNASSSGLEARIDIYQLYYLLVHLNLFGQSYKGSVTRILKTYF